MKHNTYQTLWLARCAALGTAFVGTLMFCVPILAQNFDVGSTGDLGDVVITNNTTMALPADGRLNFKSLTVNSGTTLKFSRNIQNTPVFILAQTEIVVAGTINLDGGDFTLNNGGAGGPGGFDGGKPGFGSESPPGDGYGPGGGHGGFDTCSDSATAATGGGYGTRRSSFSGSIYGTTLLIPLIGGSGAGGLSSNPNGGGGGGGGAIMLAANSHISVTGSIQARGGRGIGCINGGSGGAIRLVSFKVEGNGTLDTGPLNGNAGLGRVRIDTVIRTGIAFSINGVSSIGGNLLVFPPVIPTLNVVEAAGNAVALGSDPVVFTLAFGSSTNRTIRLQAKDFGRNVPVRVTLTPDSGVRQVFDAEVDNTTVNPAFADVPVTVPVNTLVTVHCWTR